jgi:hypothetical protein
MNSFTQLEVLVDMSRKLFSATLDFIWGFQSSGCEPVLSVTYIQVFQGSLLPQCPEDRASRFLETSVNFYQMTQCHNTVGIILCSHCHDMLRLQLEVEHFIIHGCYRLYRFRSGMLF